LTGARHILTPLFDRSKTPQDGPRPVSVKPERISRTGKHSVPQRVDRGSRWWKHKESRRAKERRTTDLSRSFDESQFKAPAEGERVEPITLRTSVCFSADLN
jgi:hypothetical protein